MRAMTKRGHQVFPQLRQRRIALRCPLGSAAPNEPCKTSGGRKLQFGPTAIRIRLFHLARIKKAAQMDRDAADL
jgi:hypothetical protein